MERLDDCRAFPMRFLFHVPKFYKCRPESTTVYTNHLWKRTAARFSPLLTGILRFWRKIKRLRYVWGCLRLYPATFDIAFLKEAVQKSDILLDEFFDRDNGGFYPYSTKDGRLISRERDV